MIVLQAMNKLTYWNIQWILKKKLGTNLIQDKYTIRFDAYTRNFFRLKAGAVSTEAVWDDEARFCFWVHGLWGGRMLLLPSEKAMFHAWWPASPEW